MGNYLKYQDIRKLHLEITSRCNAACPQCSRTAMGGDGINPNLTLKDWTAEDAEKFFPKDFLQQIESSWFCGNFGDAAANPKSFEVFKYFVENSKMTLSIYTNGGIRNEEYWKELAILLKGGRGRVRFSIDGLADTNHLYRKKTNFERIERNAKAFTNAGGNAVWDFIAFQHNEHQIDEVKQTAKDWGFSNINIKLTSRFVNHNKAQDESKGKKSNQDDKRWGVEQPKDEKLQNKEVNELPKLLKKFDSFEDYLERTEISCKVIEEESIFVDFNGDLWPCCWIGDKVYREEQTRFVRNFREAMEAYPKGFNSLHNNSLKDVMNHPYFAGDLEKSWTSDFNSKPMRLKVCANTCGKDHRPLHNQHNVEKI